ncbi:MAG: diacylglycerol/lipid kinase family protein [Gemmatimonadales bacterium]
MRADRASSFVGLIRALLIVNPTAGRGAGARAADRVARAFPHEGWAVDLARTERPWHAAELAARAGRDGVQRVIAVGGDGTVHEVANGLLGAGVPAALGVVPVGSGNDFAKLVGTFRHRPERAAARVAAARPRRFDVGRALDEYFVNSMGFGFGPAVVRARNAMPGLAGFLSYLVPVVRTFFRFRPPRFAVEAAQHTERGNMMMVEVCNGTTAGGSYRFAPEADPTDGLLDVCLVRQVSVPRFLVAIPRVMRGTHTQMKEMQLFRTVRLVIRSLDAPLLLHLDGELREPGVRDCEVTLEPRRLDVLVAP